VLSIPKRLRSMLKHWVLIWRSSGSAWDEGRHAEAVRRDLDEGRKAGVRGTPTFFLGILESGSLRVKVHRTIVGAQPYAAFREAIESLLAAQKP
jgi:predicted DsbA family dithiol-disulfide isomerase